MKRTKSTSDSRQDLSSNIVHLHILDHACRGPIFGLQMIEELGRLGYKLSPGTIYPLLRGLEERGLLRSREIKRGRSTRRLYGATAAGHKALAAAKDKVGKLLADL